MQMYFLLNVFNRSYKTSELFYEGGGDLYYLFIYFGISDIVERQEKSLYKMIWFGCINHTYTTVKQTVLYFNEKSLGGQTGSTA